MPWSASDAHKHKKGLSPDEAEKWATIANSALGASGDEGYAIRVANSKTDATKAGNKKAKEANRRAGARKRTKRRSNP